VSCSLLTVNCSPFLSPNNIITNMKKSHNKNKDLIISTALYNDARNIILNARAAAVRSVDSERVMMYWRLGERIFVEEQHGKDRADYGEYIVQNLSKQLEKEFGSGFSYRQLAYCRKFYRLYPIVNALRSQFND